MSERPFNGRLRRAKRALHFLKKRESELLEPLLKPPTSCDDPSDAARSKSNASQEASTDPGTNHDA